MIRINLLKNRGNSGSGSVTESINQDLSIIRRRGVVNLVILLLGPVALYLWEMQSIPDKQTKLSAMQVSINEATEKNSRAKDIVGEIKKFKSEQDALQSQISSLQELSKNRLREVKILDVIQKDIPEKVWLTKIEMTPSKLNISGNAVTDADLISFMEVLSRNAYLKEVSLVKSIEQNLNDVGFVKKFDVTGLLEGGQ